MAVSKYTQSTKILRSLIEGIDPQTGDELPKDGVLNRSDVMRALLSAVGALDAIGARENRRAMLPHSVGKAWSEDEEATLATEFQQGVSLGDIAKDHGRTLRAIGKPLGQDGLVDARPEGHDRRHVVARITGHRCGGLRSPLRSARFFVSCDAKRACPRNDLRLSGILAALTRRFSNEG